MTGHLLCSRNLLGSGNIIERLAPTCRTCLASIRRFMILYYVLFSPNVLNSQIPSVSS